jgi:hypothetical protein
MTAASHRLPSAALCALALALGSGVAVADQGGVGPYADGPAAQAKAAKAAKAADVADGAVVAPSPAPASSRVSQGLGKGDAPGAMGGHQKAMDALGRLQDALEQMAKGGSGSGGGVPLPFGPGQSGGGDEGGESFDPRSREKVEIPKPEQYKVPAEFREDILKAAKQNTAEAYKEAVRRYYEEIVK